MYISFYMFILYLVKTGNSTAYNTASNTKSPRRSVNRWTRKLSPHGSLIVNRLFTANVQNVAHHFSHKHAAVHATGRLRRRWHVAADQTMQQSGGASDQQRRVTASGKSALAWRPGPYSPRDSGRDYSGATGLGQWSAVSHGPVVLWCLEHGVRAGALSCWKTNATNVRQ